MYERERERKWEKKICEWVRERRKKGKIFSELFFVVVWWERKEKSQNEKSMRKNLSNSATSYWWDCHTKLCAECHLKFKFESCNLTPWKKHCASGEKFHFLRRTNFHLQILHESHRIACFSTITRTILSLSLTNISKK